MLYEFSDKNSESLAQIRAIFAEIQNFSQGIVFYWHTLYRKSFTYEMCSSNTLLSHSNFIKI